MSHLRTLYTRRVRNGGQDRQLQAAIKTTDYTSWNMLNILSKDFKRMDHLLALFTQDNSLDEVSYKPYKNRYESHQMNKDLMDCYIGV